MLKIKKLHLKNFKSFKKAEIPFAQGFTAIAGANASGKCVAGETLVLLENGTYERIDSLVEKAMKEAGAKQYVEDGTIAFAPEQKTRIFSLNPETLKIEPAIVKAFIKKSSPERLLTIRTRSGREVTTTDYHPFFSIKNGQINALKASELSTGAIVATPRKIETVKKEKLFEEFFSLVDEKDNLFAPFNEEYEKIMRNFLNEKRISIKNAAAEIGIKPIVIKGLLGKQAINFANLVKILTKMGYGHQSIAELIPHVKGKNTSKLVKMPWRNSNGFARLLGYFFAEGSIAGESVRIVSENKEMIEDIKMTCLEVFGITPFVKKYKPNAFDIIIFSKPVAKIFYKFCKKQNCNSRQKKLEKLFFLHADERLVCEFLNGYFSGDGYVSKTSVSATTASKELAVDVFNMLLMLGIQPSVSKTTKGIRKRNFKGNYFQVNIYGQENMKKFEEKVKLTHLKKNSMLKKIITKKPHFNVDLIPDINKSIKEACQEFGVKYARKKNKNIKLKSYTDNVCWPSRKGLQEVLQKEFSFVKNPSRNLVTLQKLAFSDIFWDEIVEITEQKGHGKFVYDLSIDYYHNFVANNIFVHNSNIMDSLLFVFAATSLKMLRASKLLELINHDAEEGYAKVEVDLEDGDKNFIVSRMIDSRGLSVFRIDGQKKTLNEVSSLLLELGIKPTGHNFVVQGDITRVIEMSPKQRREIVDEVAGLSEFEEKKAEAIKKLEQVEVRVRDAFLVLSEREKYLFDLEKEKQAAQKFSNLKDELAQSRATILRMEAKRTENEAAQARKKLEETKEEIARRQDDKKNFFEQEKQLEEKLEELNQKIIDSSTKAFSSIGREIEEKKAAIKISKNSKEFFESKMAEVLEKEKELSLEKKSLLQDLEEKKAQILSLKNAVLAEKNRILQLEQEISAKSGASAKNESAAKSMSESLLDAASKESRAKEAFFEARLKKEKALKEKEFLEKQLSAALLEQKNVSRKLEEKKQLEQELRQAMAQRPAELLKENQKQLEDLLSKEHLARAKIQSLNSVNSEISGISSNCPTCQQKVDKNMVKKVFDKNTKEISVLQQELSNFLFAKKSVLAQKETLEKKSEILKDLLQKQKNFEEIGQKEKEMQKTIESSREELQAIGILGLEEKMQGEKELLDAVSREKAVLEKKAQLVQESMQKTGINELIAQLKELNEKKSGKENRVNSLESEILHGIEKRASLIEKETSELKKHAQSFMEKIRLSEKEVEGISKELEKKEQEMHRATSATRLLEEEKQRIMTKSKNIEEKRAALEEKISSREKNANELSLIVSRNEIRLNDLTEELKQFEGIKTLLGKEQQELKKKVTELEKEINSLGAINMKAIEKFNELLKEVNEMKEKATRLEEERKAVLSMIEKIDLKKQEVFMECFEHISKRFSDIYFHFLAGEGRLSLTEPQKPLESGLSIEAKYKENRLKSIDSLSGGEKSLTALAFVFAIQSFEPAPFYVFDEVDAALDRENSGKLAVMLKELSRTSQFISITHNDLVIKNSDQIIGVALNKQKSSVIGLKIKEKLEEKAAA